MTKARDVALLRDYLAFKTDSPEQQAAWDALNGILIALREVRDALDEHQKLTRPIFRTQEVLAKVDTILFFAAPAADADPEVIYLQPECCADGHYGRTWCKDDAPEDCPDGVPWTKYVRAR